jgi:hypothetical protein
MTPVAHCRTPVICTFPRTSRGPAVTRGISRPGVMPSSKIFTNPCSEAAIMKSCGLTDPAEYGRVR